MSELLKPEEIIEELKEDLRVGSILVANLTDQCRELEAQLTKAHSPSQKEDRPDREKIEKLKGMIKSITTMASDRDKWSEMFDIIDQISALFPDIEQAERERILNQMELEQCDPTVMAYHNDYYWLDKDVWQALKEQK